MSTRNVKASVGVAVLPGARTCQEASESKDGEGALVTGRGNYTTREVLYFQESKSEKAF